MWRRRLKCGETNLLLLHAEVVDINSGPAENGEVSTGRAVAEGQRPRGVVGPHALKFAIFEGNDAHVGFGVVIEASVREPGAVGIERDRI
jgi:hypothetical protein